METLCMPRLCMPRWTPAVTVAASIVAAWFSTAGCSGERNKPPENLHVETSAGDQASDQQQGEHVHTAPRGGTLVELGDHFANLELLLDPAEGRLTAYVLDAHAENAIRLTDASLAARLDSLERDGREVSLFQPIQIELAAVENALTGEKVGDSSQFSAQSDDLVNASGLAGALLEISVRGQTFRDVPLHITGRPNSAGHP